METQHVIIISGLAVFSIQVMYLRYTYIVFGRSKFSAHRPSDRDPGHNGSGGHI